jgi:hypothetical protein
VTVAFSCSDRSCEKQEDPEYKAVDHYCHAEKHNCFSKSVRVSEIGDEDVLERLQNVVYEEKWEIVFVFTFKAGRLNLQQVP